MDLGGFSVSLNVKDIRASKAFYEKLGFTQYAGQLEHNWVIMKNGAHNIGLYQGIIKENVLTFNPGWDQEARNLGSFTDVRDLQERLKSAGIVLEHEVDPNTNGPGHVIFRDPDGNVIMLDQHR
ncbi:MAG: VOC family protein [Anaerolineales bacterium]|nr:VOC family protein [Anaerolineales bacterium]